MSGTFLTEIRRMAEDISAREGCYLYDIEFVGAGGARALRVYVDRDAAGGISIDDCSKISRELTQILDADENFVPGGQYDLEVSSPGLERVLKEPRHFERALGKRISVKAFGPLLEFNPDIPELDKAKQIQGSLISFDESGLRIALEGSSVTPVRRTGASANEPGTDMRTVFVPLNSMTKAHIVFEFVEAGEKKPKGKLKK